VNPYLTTALAALEDLRDEIHRDANRQFFRLQFVAYGDLQRDEATVRNAIQLLRSIPHPPTLPAEVHHSEQLAS
jgi:hypothetical protein